MMHRISNNGTKTCAGEYSNQLKQVHYETYIQHTNDYCVYTCQAIFVTQLI